MQIFPRVVKLALFVAPFARPDLADRPLFRPPTAFVGLLRLLQNFNLGRVFFFFLATLMQWLVRFDLRFVCFFLFLFCFTLFAGGCYLLTFSRC